MKLSKNQFIIFLFAILSIILLFWIFSYINFLTNNKYIVECFDTLTQIYKDIGTPDTNHNVDLPLTTTYSCGNFCGPPSRCSITGQQCMSDIDCPGCNPYQPPLKSISTACVPGNNDAGKLTGGYTPTYSSLTTDIGTQARIYSYNKFKKPAMANFGVNTWITAYNNSMIEFDKRYKPSGLTFMPDYRKRYTLTGEFIDDGPLASNSYLS
jgi:hypothetical protein